MIGQVNDIKFSTMVKPDELKVIVQNHNSLIENLQSSEKEQASLKLEIEELQQTLNKELSKEQPNIQEITERMVNKERDALTKKHQAEIDQIQKDLMNRVEKVLKLEM